MENLTVKGVADRLGIALSTAYQLISSRKIAHIRVGGRGGAIRVPAAALAEYIQRSTVAVSLSEPG